MSRQNIIIGLLILVLIVSIGVNFYQWSDTQRLNGRIKNKDKAITEIRNSIKIITQTDDSIDSIRAAIEKDFSFVSEIIFRDLDSSFYFVTSPKDWNDIDYQEIWDFYGLEIVFDSNKKFKRIDFYKP